MTSLLGRWVARIESSARVQWWVTFLPALVAYLASLRIVASGMSADPTGVVPSAWGIAHHGSPIIPRDQWPYFNPWSVAVGADEVVSNRTPGLVYLAAPVYWIFSWADTWEPLPASALAALITASAVATFGVLIRRLVGGARAGRIGLGASLVGGFATTTWAVSGTQLFPHGPDQLLLVLAMLGIAAGGSVLAGLAFAAAVLIRPPLAVAAAALGLAASWARRTPVPALIIGSLTAVGLMAFALYSHHYWNVVSVDEGESTLERGILNGTATHGYFDSLTDWSPASVGEFGVKLVGALVSPGRGLLIGAPFLLLLVPGLRRAWRAAPIWVRGAAIGGVAYLLIQLKAEIFSGGQYFWSYRYPLEALTLCAPLLVLAWRLWTARGPVRRAVFAALVAIAVGFQAVGAFSFHGPYPDTPWTFDNLHAALTGAQAAPGWMALVLSVLAAAAILWRAARRAVDGRRRVAAGRAVG